MVSEKRPLRMRAGWLHDWHEPDPAEHLSVREIVRGPFTSPQLVASTPFVLLASDKRRRPLRPLRAPATRRGANLRTGIPDPWAEYLTFRGEPLAGATVASRESELWSTHLDLTERAWREQGMCMNQGIPDPWKSWPKAKTWRGVEKKKMKMAGEDTCECGCHAAVGAEFGSPCETERKQDQAVCSLGCDLHKGEKVSAEKSTGSTCPVHDTNQQKCDPKEYTPENTITICKCSDIEIKAPSLRNQLDLPCHGRTCNLTTHVTNSPQPTIPCDRVTVQTLLSPPCPLSLTAPACDVSRVKILCPPRTPVCVSQPVEVKGVCRAGRTPELSPCACEPDNSKNTTIKRIQEEIDVCEKYACSCSHQGPIQSLENREELNFKKKMVSVAPYCICPGIKVNSTYSELKLMKKISVDKHGPAHSSCLCARHVVDKNNIDLIDAAPQMQILNNVSCDCPCQETHKKIIRSKVNSRKKTFQSGDRVILKPEQENKSLSQKKSNVDKIKCEPTMSFLQVSIKPSSSDESDCVAYYSLSYMVDQKKQNPSRSNSPSKHTKKQSNKQMRGSSVERDTNISVEDPHHSKNLNHAKRNLASDKNTKMRGASFIDVSNENRAFESINTSPKINKHTNYHALVSSESPGIKRNLIEKVRQHISKSKQGNEINSPTPGHSPNQRINSSHFPQYANEKQSLATLNHAKYNTCCCQLNTLESRKLSTVIAEQTATNSTKTSKKEESQNMNIQILPLPDIFVSPRTESLTNIPHRGVTREQPTPPDLYTITEENSFPVFKEPEKVEFINLSKARDQNKEVPVDSIVSSVTSLPLIERYNFLLNLMKQEVNRELNASQNTHPAQDDDARVSSAGLLTNVRTPAGISLTHPTSPGSSIAERTVANPELDNDSTGNQSSQKSQCAAELSEMLARRVMNADKGTKLTDTMTSLPHDEQSKSPLQSDNKKSEIGLMEKQLRMLNYESSRQIPLNNENPNPQNKPSERDPVMRVTRSQSNKSPKISQVCDSVADPLTEEKHFTLPEKSNDLFTLTSRTSSMVSECMGIDHKPSFTNTKKSPTHSRDADALNPRDAVRRLEEIQHSYSKLGSSPVGQSSCVLNNIYLDDDVNVVSNETTESSQQNTCEPTARGRERKPDNALRCKHTQATQTESSPHCSIKTQPKTFRTLRDLGKTNMRDLGKTNMRDLGKTNMRDIGKTNMRDLGKTNMRDLGKTNPCRTQNTYPDESKDLRYGKERLQCDTLTMSHTARTEQLIPTRYDHRVQTVSCKSRCLAANVENRKDDLRTGQQTSSRMPKNHPVNCECGKPGCKCDTRFKSADSSYSHEVSKRETLLVARGYQSHGPLFTNHTNDKSYGPGKHDVERDWRSAPMHVIPNDERKRRDSSVTPSKYHGSEIEKGWKEMQSSNKSTLKYVSPKNDEIKDQSSRITRLQHHGSEIERDWRDTLPSNTSTLKTVSPKNEERKDKSPQVTRFRQQGSETERCWKEKPQSNWPKSGAKYVSPTIASSGQSSRNSRCKHQGSEIERGWMETLPNYAMSSNTITKVKYAIAKNQERKEPTTPGKYLRPTNKERKELSAMSAGLKCLKTEAARDARTTPLRNTGAMPVEREVLCGKPNCLEKIPRVRYENTGAGSGSDWDRREAGSGRERNSSYLPSDNRSNSKRSNADQEPARTDTKGATKKIIPFSARTPHHYLDKEDNWNERQLIGPSTSLKPPKIGPAISKCTENNRSHKIQHKYPEEISHQTEEPVAFLFSNAASIKHETHRPKENSKKTSSSSSNSGFQETDMEGGHYAEEHQFTRSVRNMAVPGDSSSGSEVSSGRRVPNITAKLSDIMEVSPKSSIILVDPLVLVAETDKVVQATATASCELLVSDCLPDVGKEVVADAVRIPDMPSTSANKRAWEIDSRGQHSDDELHREGNTTATGRRKVPFHSGRSDNISQWVGQVSGAKVTSSDDDRSTLKTDAVLSELSSDPQSQSTSDYSSRGETSSERSKKRDPRLLTSSSLRESVARPLPAARDADGSGPMPTDEEIEDMASLSSESS